MTQDSGFGEWWQAVRSVAALVGSEGLVPTDASSARVALEKLGYGRDDIARALAWLEQASLSGSLHDALGMLQPQRAAARVAHPVERAFLHEDLWERIVACRTRGLLPDEFAERLIEGLRSVDTRDWDETELSAFIDEVLASSLPEAAAKDLRSFLSGRLPTVYH